MNSKHHMLVAALVIIIVLLLLSLFPASFNDDTKSEKFSVYPCESLVSGCQAIIGDKKIEIKFPGNIVFLKQFPVEIRFPGHKKVAIDQVVVDFQMVGMNMGINKYLLKLDENDKTLWAGKAVLPVCTTGRTDWQAIVSVKQGDEVQRVAFQFEVMPGTQ